ncbi:hypothetical protein LK994_08185 [Ferruginibacter lapsinanis]|uniref:hypothetical protein n=1 Tax=Ferruginibacter lapsinanis TaxID=563172 RepID=UPI001E300724|nr:hypothetical protein [Ferruginibacter lapsinanis]UEG48614.1 hypothetical protein LK994_08185 [Ferruginibacter lapsinanis]
MYNIIATSLFQNKICLLPGIGALSVETLPAETDFVNSRILAPQYTIEFSTENEGNAPFNEFSAISQLLRNEIDHNGSAEITGVGVFSKDESGKITFEPEKVNAAFTYPVNAERVIRQNAAHAMLVGDKETTNVVMTEYFTEEILQKDRWWIWAIVLGVLGIAAIVFHFTQHGYTTGNSHILGAVL